MIFTIRVEENLKLNKLIVNGLTGKSASEPKFIYGNFDCLRFQATMIRGKVEENIKYAQPLVKLILRI